MLALADPLESSWTSAAASGPVAQSPRPSRYRGGHRVDYYHPLWLLAAWVLSEVLA